MRYGLPEGTRPRDLLTAGAVGDLLGRYLDAEGRPIDHPLNRQVLSPELEDYRKIPCRIVASGSAHKRAVLLAVAKAELANVIVTDADSARAMLGDQAT